MFRFVLLSLFLIEKVKDFILQPWYLTLAGVTVSLLLVYLHVLSRQTLEP